MTPLTWVIVGGTGLICLCAILCHLANKRDQAATKRRDDAARTRARNRDLTARLVTARRDATSGSQKNTGTTVPNRASHHSGSDEPTTSPLVNYTSTASADVEPEKVVGHGVTFDGGGASSDWGSSSASDSCSASDSSSSSSSCGD